MSVNKYLEGLAKPFDAECVKWRIQVTNNEKDQRTCSCIS